jgi:hypothetical protein
VVDKKRSEERIQAKRPTMVITMTHQTSTGQQISSKGELRGFGGTLLLNHATEAQFDLALINRRVDEALAVNRRAERIITWMTVGIFFLGLAVVVVGYWAVNPYISGGAIFLEGILYWPIRELLKLRRENLSLQIVPAILTALPPEVVAQEFVNLLKSLRPRK